MRVLLSPPHNLILQHVSDKFHRFSGRRRSPYNFEVREGGGVGVAFADHHLIEGNWSNFL